MKTKKKIRRALEDCLEAHQAFYTYPGEAHEAARTKHYVTFLKAKTKLTKMISEVCKDEN